MATERRPYYLKYIEWNPTGEHKMVGYSCVRKLPDGTESDWHRVGLMLKPEAERRRKALNDANERRLDGKSRPWTPPGRGPIKQAGS